MFNNNNQFVYINNNNNQFVYINNCAYLSNICILYYNTLMKSKINIIEKQYYSNLLRNCYYYELKNLHTKI